jgi:beta-glucanase (GH16 family)
MRVGKVHAAAVGVVVAVAVAALGFVRGSVGPPAAGSARNVGPSPAPGIPFSRVRGPLRYISPPVYASRLGSGWKPSFAAAFTGSRLDTSLWGTCYPWEAEGGCTNFGNSDEDEWYVPAQDQVYDGALHLIARQAPTPGLSSNGGEKTYAYRSGMVTTYPGFRFQYGYLQVIAQIPYGLGLWPALWLAPANKAWPPEIDILEHYGTAADYTQHLHAANMSVLAGSEDTVNLAVGWHAFGLYWSPSRIIWYVDGQPVLSASQGVPQQPMYFIANLAVYQQNVAGSAALDIRSVTVWQAAAYAG